MGYSNGVISAPISVSDPYYVMGVGQYNGTWDLKYICTHDSINKFSYIRPKEHTSVEFNNELLPGFRYDSVNKVIVSDKPVTWFRLLDFDGYNHNAIPPTIDIDKKLTPIDKAGNKFTLVVKPYFGDSRYKWDVILGGHDWVDMMILVECYSQRKTLMDSIRTLVSDIHPSGRITATVYSSSQLDDSDTHIFVKGYFCSNDGTILAPIPTIGDGFVQLAIVYTQSVYIYIGTVTLSDDGLDISKFAVRGEIIGYDGGTSAAARIYITNNNASAYRGDEGRPYVRYRWRAVDGEYSGKFEGGIELPLAKNIPGGGFTRSDRVQPGAPPSYGSVTKWYIDYEIVL